MLTVLLATWSLNDTTTGASRGASAPDGKTVIVGTPRLTVKAVEASTMLPARSWTLTTAVCAPLDRERKVYDEPAAVAGAPPSSDTVAFPIPVPTSDADHSTVTMADPKMVLGSGAVKESAGGTVSTVTAASAAAGFLSTSVEFLANE